MESLGRYRYCFIAGCCAALGSFFGKLPAIFTVHFTNVTVVHLVLPLVLMVVFNALNLCYYLRALHTADQTLTSTVLTAASNFTLSFILGVFVFHEVFSWISILGIAAIVAGLWLLCDDNQTSSKPEKIKQT